MLDGLWLGMVAKSFYQTRLDGLLAQNVNLVAAVVFYLVYTVGIVFFCVRPAMEEESARTALVYGAMLGLLAYGAYDLTNLATLRDWPLDVTLVDIGWGVALTAISAYAGFLAGRMLA
jgi:uncharacterized membrane protein